MLDIATVRLHADELQRIAHLKGIPLVIADLIQCDDERKRLLQEMEQLRHQRNMMSQQIAALLRQGKHAEAEADKQKVKSWNDQLQAFEAAFAVVIEQYEQQMLMVPNLVSPETPVGTSDEHNIELVKVGDIRVFEFEPMDHVQLAEQLDMLDIERGVKLGGSRHYVLKGAGFHLHRAVQQLAIDLLEQRGFTMMDVPVMVRQDALLYSGFLPLGADQVYRIADENRYMVGTSEVSLVSYYANEVLSLDTPARLAAATTCFRREIGSAGRDVHGLYRVHQFAKVEQVVFCKNDPVLSNQLLHEITDNAEHLLQLLELPYRKVAVCVGDMSQKGYQQYDIETWMPSRQAYGETHSSSNLHDFQARRANIRYRDDNGKLQYAHTLNNTAVATPRILIPLIENHQQKDGSIVIPKALRPYMRGLERITK